MKLYDTPYEGSETYFYFSDHVGEYYREQRRIKPEPVAKTVRAWTQWCGETPWTKYLIEFGQLGGLITYWCGVPRSASAIPLTFSLHYANGERIEGCDNSRLKDLRAAVAILKARKEAAS